MDTDNDYIHGDASLSGNFLRHIMAELLSGFPYSDNFKAHIERLALTY
jgi:hypothetical protein